MLPASGPIFIASSLSLLPISLDFSLNSYLIFPTAHLTSPLACSTDISNHTPNFLPCHSLPQTSAQKPMTQYWLLSLLLYIQSISTSYWLYIQNISRINHFSPHYLIHSIIKKVVHCLDNCKGFLSGNALCCLPCTPSPTIYSPYYMELPERSFQMI